MKRHFHIVWVIIKAWHCWVTWRGPALTSSKSDRTLCQSPVLVQKVPTPSTVLAVVSLTWLSCSPRCGEVSFSSSFYFNLHFPDGLWHWWSSSVFIFPPVPSLAKCLFKSFLYFYGVIHFLGIEFESSLYILGTGSMSNLWFASIFSLPVACLFMLLKVQVKKTYVFNLNEIQFIYVASKLGLFQKFFHPHKFGHTHSGLL